MRKDLGPVFSEGIEKNGARRTPAGKHRLKDSEQWSGGSFFALNKDDSFHEVSRWRLAFLFIIFTLLFIVLGSRIFDLQVIQGDKFLGKAEGNHYRVEVDHAPRGVVYDRNGAILARNVPAFRVAIDGSALPEKGRESVLEKLSKIINVPTAEIVRELKTGSSDSPLTIKSGVSHDVALNLQTSGLPGVEVEISPKRKYPYGAILAAVLGYTSEVSEQELRNPSGTPYQLGDRVGRAGVEESFENTLRGEDGYNLLKVDATGKKVGSLITTSPVAGGDVNLSIDLGLQKKVDTTLKKWLKHAGAKAGSAVVMNPTTGEILALVSVPSFNDNLFEEGLTQTQYNKLINDQEKPLINRVIGSAYPSGSTFKLITAAAGLESGSIKPDTKILDTGYVQIGSQIFNNWLWLSNHKTEGAINVVRAIARSNDTFFFKLSQMIGPKVIQDMARKFSIGSITGIDLPGETPGLLPTESWKQKVFRQPWYPGDTLNMAIGQGNLMVSPLQLSLVTSVYANGGKLVRPTVLKTDAPQVIRSGFLSKETIKIVKEGMYQDQIGDGNVGWLFGNYKIKTAGKTGTAESGGQRPQAWYTAFAPFDKPQIVVTAMAENAGHGSEVCAPATKEIFDWWFAHHKP